VTTSIEALPKNVVGLDHRLQNASEASARELMELRWHWTLDEANDRRVSFSQYARDVGMNRQTIMSDARAHTFITANPNMTTDTARERAKTDAEKFQAIEAVAQARGVGAHTARQRYQDEVKRVRTYARDRAEQNDTTVEQEIPKVAKALVQQSKSEERQRENARKEHGQDWFVISGGLAKAALAVTDVVSSATRAEFSGKERELLRHQMATVREALDLLDDALGGKPAAGIVRKLEVLRGGLSA